MGPQAEYDPEGDVLHLFTGETPATASSLVDQDDVAVQIATEDGHDLVGIIVIGVSAYLPLGKRGYNVETDTLTLGTVVEDPALVTENGDLMGYWQVDEDEPDSS